MIVPADGARHGGGRCGEMVKIVGKEFDACAERVGPVVEPVHGALVCDGYYLVKLCQVALIDAGDGEAPCLHGLFKEVGIDLVAHFQVKGVGLGA